MAHLLLVSPGSVRAGDIAVPSGTVHRELARWYDQIVPHLETIHGTAATEASKFRMDPEGSDAVPPGNPYCTERYRREHPVPASIHERAQCICEVYNILYTNSYGAEVVRFLINYTAIPIAIHEPSLLGRNPALAQMYECLTNKDWFRAACWLCAGIFDAGRHFFYPERATLDMHAEYPQVIAWMREMKQRSPEWTMIRSLFGGASNVKSLCGMNDLASTEAKFGSSKSARVLVLHHALEVLLGRVQGEQIEGKARLATRHGSTFEDMVRDIYARLMNMYVFEIGTGVLGECSYYTQSPDGLAIPMELARALGLPEDPTKLTPAQLAMLCELHEVVSEIEPRPDLGIPQLPPGRESKYIEAVVEIKCQYIKYGAYLESPLIYIGQLLQGMYTHGTTKSHFVASHYAPHRHDTEYPLPLDELDLSIEEATASETLRDLYIYILSECARLVSTPEPVRDIVIPPTLAKFVEEFRDYVRDPKHFQRRNLEVKVRGCTYVARGLTMTLMDALGDQEAVFRWQTVSCKMYEDTVDAWIQLPPEAKTRAYKPRVVEIGDPPRRRYTVDTGDEDTEEGTTASAAPPRAPPTYERAMELLNRALKRAKVCPGYITPEVESQIKRNRTVARKAAEREGKVDEFAASDAQHRITEYFAAPPPPPPKATPDVIVID